jgi:hypothetical protein
MILSTKSLEKLRNLLNEETEYRSGPKLVAFFNDLGSNDVYGQGFPSRWQYTDSKLEKLNGTPELDKCIKRLFAPINFIGRYPELDALIEGFNQFLAFDKWSVVRHNTEITFKRVDKLDIPKAAPVEDIKEDVFLNKDFKDVSIDKLGLDATLTEIINSRFREIQKCIQTKSSLAVIFLAGSSLEGILLGFALKSPKEFNQLNSAPKDTESKVKPFHQWSLSNLIDAAHELGMLREDVKKFSHALRDFRNYIHPLQQASTRFHPDEHTALICWQVLRAAISQLASYRL